ncbi:Putative sulfate permease and related transporters (modular protein) [Magnetospirillum sp. XM-1]|uniref:SulP family inorganic anion transporter n=1 Tax=Magnetospirillum sp. XM-1 TaxID=1663591 RepID=UPI00073E0EE9|nr:SulP family inorganic anion transporter [Magnetospirillum sp. XM-1]CUW41316.1 Putative sulfate permease and related transporters (modular protein) [Magnetospirillum sp. XM-1]
MGLDIACGNERYGRVKLTGDAWGGLAAMLVALPSAIAFGVTIFAPLGGSLAAQGAMAGILGATALGMLAPLFGSSARLISAPCAPAAAMLSAQAYTLTGQGLPAGSIVLLLGLTALLAGLFQIALGLLRIGRLIKFIPYPVVCGYLSGVGLIIIGSQIPKLLGVPGGVSLWAALSLPSLWVWQSVVVGAVVIAVMVLTPRITRSVPPAILALAAGLAAYFALAAFDPALMTIDGNRLLVGKISAGGYGVGATIGQHWRSLGALEPEILLEVVIPALTLAALLSIDTLKTCVVLDAMTNSTSNPDRDLLGQGIGNAASALVGGVPGAGTMGASLINVNSGASTRVSGLLAGSLCFAAFLVLSPVIAWVPVPALAAILIVIGFRMIDRHSLAFFYTPATRLDFLVITAVIVVALFGNLIAASGVGVAFAILLFIREQTRSTVVRNRIEGNQIFSKRLRSSDETAQAEQGPCDTVVFELQGSLFFGTASQLHAALEPETHSRKFVILSMRRVQSLDLTATHVLEQIKDRLEENDAFLVFCDIPKGLPSGLKMKRFLKDTGVVRPTNKAFAFRQLDEALEWVEEQRTGVRDAEGDGELVLGIADMPMFAGLPPETLADLNATVTLRPVHAGKKVFKAGVAGDELFLIRRGTVRITLPIHKKEHYHLATCGPGEIIGGIGFLDAGNHAADAVAITEVEVYVLSREGFTALGERHPGLAFRLIENVALNLADRLRATVSEIHALRG